MIDVEILKQAEHFGLSQSEMEKFAIYEKLLTHWQKKLNLVGPSTLEQFWNRHLLDSIQLLPLIRKYQNVHPDLKMADVGTGAGIPGLLLAMAGVANITLIESDFRKCAFLREVSRETETRVIIQSKRIESISDLKFDLITARALASLPKLFGLCQGISKPDTVFIFLKGNSVKEEISESGTSWQFDHLSHKSLTNDSSVVLEITNLKAL